MHIKPLAKCLAYGKFYYIILYNLFLKLLYYFKNYYSIGDPKRSSHQDEGYNFERTRHSLA